MRKIDNGGGKKGGSKWIGPYNSTPLGKKEKRRKGIRGATLKHGISMLLRKGGKGEKRENQLLDN